MITSPRDTHPVDRIYGTLKIDRPVDALIDEMRDPRPAAFAQGRRPAAKKREVRRRDPTEG